MLLKNERFLISDYGLKLIKKGLTKGTGGNLSIYNRDKQLIAISPSGLSYQDITPEKVVVIDLEGNILESSYKPSTEYQLHKIFYEKRKDVNAIIHTHPTYCTTIACLNQEIPPIHYLIAYSGLKVPCANYAPFGTKNLAKNTYKAIGKKYNAALLANHGLITVGENIEDTLKTSEMIEFCAEIYYRSKSIGKPKILSKKHMTKVIKNFKDYRK